MEQADDLPATASKSTNVPPSTDPIPFADVLTQIRNSDTFIYSHLTADGWSLQIMIPANGSYFVLQNESSVDPAPSLSNDGARLAYLTDSLIGYVIQILDLSSGRTQSIALPQTAGLPSNLAWTINDYSLLVTIQPAEELQILQIDLASKEPTEFLPPWSANPSISKTGEMVYVVPFRNSPTELGLVLANQNGKALGQFVLYAPTSENYPSLDSAAELVAYSISNGANEPYTLGVSRRLESDSFLAIPIQSSFDSLTPVRTAWIDAEHLAVGTCGDNSCQILTYSLSGSTTNPIEIPGATSLGNIVFRSGH